MPESVAMMVVILGITVGGPMIGWIVRELAVNWHKVRVSEHLAALKQSMVERGMSAEEIERVINAGMTPDDAPAKASVHC